MRLEFYVEELVELYLEDDLDSGEVEDDEEHLCQRIALEVGIEYRFIPGEDM